MQYLDKPWGLVPPYFTNCDFTIAPNSFYFNGVLVSYEVIMSFIIEGAWLVWNFKLKDFKCVDKVTETYKADDDNIARDVTYLYVVMSRRCRWCEVVWELEDVTVSVSACAGRGEGGHCCDCVVPTHVHLVTYVSGPHVTSEPRGTLASSSITPRRH